jgi:hypothetical protein
VLEMLALDDCRCLKYFGGLSVLYRELNVRARVGDSGALRLRIEVEVADVGEALGGKCIANGETARVDDTGESGGELNQCWLSDVSMRCLRGVGACMVGIEDAEGSASLPFRLDIADDAASVGFAGVISVEYLRDCWRALGARL